MGENRLQFVSIYVVKSQRSNIIGPYLTSRRDIVADFDIGIGLTNVSECFIITAICGIDGFELCQVGDGGQQLCGIIARKGQFFCFVVY